jgi:hypothetical protein
VRQSNGCRGARAASTLSGNKLLIKNSSTSIGKKKSDELEVYAFFRMMEYEDEEYLLLEISAALVSTILTNG